jgi:hypothetical protein
LPFNCKSFDQNFIKRVLRSKKEWTKLKDGMEITVFEYQSSNWKHPRRMMAARNNIEILTKATGKLLLFDGSVGRYRYSLSVTHLELPAEQVWRLSYKDRADAENRIKELKYDFRLDSFCKRQVLGTEAAFGTTIMGNMMRLFRQIVLQTQSQTTLSALRFIPLSRKASWITKHAGKTTHLCDWIETDMVGWIIYYCNAKISTI